MTNEVVSMYTLKLLVEKIRSASGTDKYISQNSGCASSFFCFSEEDIARREFQVKIWKISQKLTLLASEIPDWLLPDAHGRKGGASHLFIQEKIFCESCN